MSEQTNILKTLWLPGWYPSKIDFLPGDFTDRHAAAVSQFASVSVLYVTKDPSLTNNKSVVETKHSGQHRTYRAYYNSPAGWGIISKLWSAVLYFRLLFKLYQIAKKDVDRFDLVHVHISLRQGLFAQWLKRQAGLPYVITEQNSWFMPIGDQFYPRSTIMRRIIKSNFKHANEVHTVSSSLGKQLQLKFPFIKTFKVIPNVVDTNIFGYLPKEAHERSFSFFTITGDVYHKNTDGIIRAFATYIQGGKGARLRIAGPVGEDLKTLARQLSVGHAIDFLGAIGYEQVAREMQRAHALIFFTRYETFGCVMAEALCCGTPVIASKIPVLQENLTDFKNAVFVTAEDETDLATKLAYFENNLREFDQQRIAADARDKYNYASIGSQFLQWYQQVLEHA